MFGQITIADYSSDWAIEGRHVDPRSTPGYMTREEVVESYAALGIDGIELNESYWGDCAPARLKQLAANAGLPIVTYVITVDLAVGGDARHRALDEISRLLERTTALGASRIFLIPALHKPEFSRDRQRGWLIENLRAAAELAASAKVTLLSENIDYPPTRIYMGSGVDCRDICAAVDSPAFRLIYDAAAHLFVGDAPEPTLEAMFPDAQHVHLKNYRSLGPGEHANRSRESIGGNAYLGTTLDEGLISVEWVVAELRRRNYDGYLQIEYQGQDDPRVALKHNVAYLRGLLARLAPASGAQVS